MMVNPNPSRITDEMWRLWTDRPNPSWKLSGIYAFKKAYHSSVLDNQQNWPDNYSIKLPLDLVGPKDKARAIDLTMTDLEMVKWTSRMKASAENPLDHRLSAVKEFYGTLDNKTVFGLSKNDTDGPWRISSADSTHLWHGHMSIFTKFVNNWSMLAPIISVWSGQSLAEWSVGVFPKKGDFSEEVKYWQNIHNAVRKQVEPDSPAITVDGHYGPATISSFTDFAKKNGAITTYNADKMTGWLALKYHTAMVKTFAPKPPVVPSEPAISDAVLKELVNQWLTTNVPQEWKISGNITGKVVL